MADQEFRAGRAGERPFAPDVPTNENFSGEYVPQGMLDKLRQNLLMGGATDVRNMARGMAPAGHAMMLARPPGMLGGMARGGNAMRDPAEQMFDMAQAAPKMGQGGFIDPQLLRMLGYAIPAAGAAYGGYKLYDAVKGLANRMDPEKRSDAGMLEQIARAPAPRPSGAGDRRDKRLREAEDRDVKTS